MANQEHAPDTNNSSEDESSTKTNKRRRTTGSRRLIEQALDTSISEKAGKDIGRSIFEYDGKKRASPELFQALKKDDESVEASEKILDDDTTIELGDESAESVEQLSELDAEELEHIKQSIAEEHLQAIDDSETMVDDQTDFLGRVAGGEDTETAFAAVATEIGLSEDEIAEALAEMAAAEASVTAEESEIAETDSEADETDEDEPDDAEDTSARPSSTGSTSTSGTPPPSGTGGRGGSGTTPPPTGTPPPPPPPVGSPPPGGLPTRFNQVPVTPNRQPLPRLSAQERQRARAGQLLLVGLVGYLVGRRRGRIRTEKRLLPVQRRLEKRVTALERDLTYKERALVQARQRVEQRSAVGTRAEQPRVTHQEAATAARQENRQVVPIERTQPGRRETRIGLEKPVRAERLGHLVVAAEAPSGVERPVSLSAIKPERVKDMSRNEILELSEKIIVEGASLRRIYESNLVGERQLRHLVSEYLQGKDIRKDLRQEMVEHEIDFERDPIMRDRIRSRLKNNSGGKGGLNEMLASVGITDDTDAERSRQAEKSERQAALARDRRQKQQRVVADTAMATVIVVLAVIVAILVLGR